MSDISDGNNICGGVVKDEKEDLSSAGHYNTVYRNDYVAIALIGVRIFKDNFASTFKLIYEGMRAGIMQ